MDIKSSTAVDGITASDTPDAPPTPPVGFEPFLFDAFDSGASVSSQKDASSSSSVEAPGVGKVTLASDAQLEHSERSSSNALVVLGDVKSVAGRIERSGDVLNGKTTLQSSLGSSVATASALHAQANAEGSVLLTPSLLNEQGTANAEAHLAQAHQTLSVPHGVATADLDGDIGHAQATATASIVASKANMSIDATVTAHVDLNAIDGHGGLHVVVPVPVGNETLHVKVDLDGSGALGANGDLQVRLHVGPDGASLNGGVSGSLANASLQGHIEIDGGDGKELADAQLKGGAAYGVSQSKEWSWGGGWGGLQFSGKLSTGPLSLKWTATVKPTALLMEIPRCIKP